jgi:hypothetical protein
MKNIKPRTIALSLPPRTMIFLRLVTFVSFILIIFFAVFYIFQVNAQIKEKNLIFEFEKNQKELYGENRNLEVAFSQKNYLKNLENSFQELGFEKIAKVDYIKVLENSVAVKQ